MIRVAVLCGGNSAERFVSKCSAVQIVAALRTKGFEVDVIDPVDSVVPRSRESEYFSDNDNEQIVGQTLDPLKGVSDLEKYDVAFLALHGGIGENGTMQGVLEALSVPYTGSTAVSSAVAMNKDMAKRLMRYAGVMTPDWLLNPVSAQHAFAILGAPLIVKPNQEGSTFGLTLVDSEDEFDAAISDAREYDQDVIVEQFIEGREVTVGILDGEPLAIGEILLHGPIFDYESKYNAGAVEEVFPADVSQAQAAMIRSAAVNAHHALRLRDYSRVDFRLDDQGKLWCLEVNTLPGMTATSLFPQSASAVGLEFPKLCERIVKLALERNKMQLA